MSAGADAATWCVFQDHDDVRQLTLELASDGADAVLFLGEPAATADDMVANVSTLSLGYTAPDAPVAEVLRDGAGIDLSAWRDRPLFVGARPLGATEVTLELRCE